MYVVWGCFALSLFLLSSCGGTRSTLAPRSSEELTGLVLVIEEMPDGQVRHSWLRAAEVELSRYERLSNTEGKAGRILLPERWSVAMSIDKLTRKALDCIYRTREDSPSPEDQEILDVAANAIHFIASIGKLHAFEHYLASIASGGQPPPLYSFDTREEADAWLKNHPEPPHGASVSIAGKDYTVAYFRELNHRALLYRPSLDELERVDDQQLQGKSPGEES